ncbi:MAG: bifunctional UDP-N-acetylglucosamine diphosphorylase/glucosamine-1-phosphate N-acetyltransferase GlmU [Bacillota bacterium]|nr:bifunctional UDP-N-acetylglucosamine diphosphorylase/glucosamine-1-phosphate N-acetyltransferase GlmU [Bacillota bacterium]
MASLAAVVLAAGKGTRMKSRYPKVLHRVAGRPMLAYVLDAVESAGADRVVVVAGFGLDAVRAAVGTRAEVVCQEEQLGTAHALLQAEERLAGEKADVLVVCGDTPLLRGRTLADLVAYHREAGVTATVLTTRMEDPTGYGRVLRGEDGLVRRIVEQKDASPAELAVDEINTGVYCFAAEGLFDALRRIGRENRQGEYYLTDIVSLYVREERPVASWVAADPTAVMGINDRVQLARAEQILRRRIVERLMLDGVTVIDPATTFVDAGVSIAPDTVIYPFTIIEGETAIGRDCIIGPQARLVDCRLGDGVTFQNSIALESEVGDGTTVGPFAYLRPGNRIGARARIGDFVEMKKSVVGEGSKIPHLSYIGDALIGSGVNVGAGTITCNYDGRKKSATVIEDGAFIGSNANLVAPVKVGRGAYIGAGSTITQDVPPGALGVARGRQKNIEGWAARKKDA